MHQENFFMTFYGGDERMIRVILPDSYNYSDNYYPVLYMFDGQNLFNKRDAYTGTTWGVREALKKLTKTGESREMIIVGLDNAGDRRLHEYAPWDCEFEGEFIQAEGMEFADFFANAVVGEIDSRYRTVQDKAHRFVAGSSMGGLISAYTILAYPDTFGKAGVFSLASMMAEPQFLEFAEFQGRTEGNQFYIMVGAQEGKNHTTGRINYNISNSYINCTLHFMRALLKNGADPDDMDIIISAGDSHCEQAWRKQMPNFIRFLNK